MDSATPADYSTPGREPRRQDSILVIEPLPIPGAEPGAYLRDVFTMITAQHLSTVKTQLWCVENGRHASDLPRQARERSRSHHIQQASRTSRSLER